MSVDDVSFEPNELKNQQLPTLQNDYAGEIERPDAWARHLLAECRDALAKV